jgi:hypothetical protein
MVVPALSCMLLLLAGLACSYSGTESDDQELRLTVDALAAENAAQATDLARQAEFIMYLATRGPMMVTPIPPGAKPTPYRPVVGSVNIEKGRCCVAGMVGEPTEISVDFQAESLAGETVTEMRVRISGIEATEGELEAVPWEPFLPQKVYQVETPVNWLNLILSVQFRDRAGNLSRVFSDQVLVEGMPDRDSGIPEDWYVYENVPGRFTISVPSSLGVVEKSGLIGGSIGNRIEFNVVEGSNTWVDCQEGGVGDCPVMEVIELIQLGDHYATRISGYIGTIGGNIPQEFVTYVVEFEERYYIFSLWAVEFDAQVSSQTDIWPLSSLEVERFDEMMQTFKIIE